MRDSQLGAELARRKEASEQAVTAYVRNPCRDQREVTDRVLWGNAAWLRQVLAAHGWPGVSMVGERGSKCASLIAQLAEDDVELQRLCLVALERAVADGDASARDLAYLTDRLRASQGQPQIYGTKFLADENGHLEPYPIDDPDNVDLRRAAVGLTSLAQYANDLRRQYAEIDRELS